MRSRSEFGIELRRRRQDAGLSLTQLADRIHYSKGHLSKIESGTKAANPTLAMQCDSALGAQGALAAMVTEQPVLLDDDEQDDADLGGGSWAMRLSSDGAVQLARDVGDSVAFHDASAFAPSFGADRSPADPTAMLAMFGVRFEQTRALSQMMSPVLVLPGLIGDAHLLRGLAWRAPQESAPPLWRLAAQFAEFAGWMFQELGDDRQAIWWTDYAVRMAERGADLSLRPYGLFRRSDITLHADDPQSTIDLARRIQADPATTVRVRGLAVQREAHAHALLGEHDACMRALERSAALLDEATRAHAGGRMLGMTLTPDPTTMARGWCLFDLGKPAEAAEVLETGITGFAAGANRARARYAARTALAQAAAGEVERACEIVEWLADDLRQIDSATVRHDVRLLYRELRRRSGQTRVRDLLPVLADLLRGPDVRP
jgi:DNA-binding XRE family transcriptional regulator